MAKGEQEKQKSIFDLGFSELIKASIAGVLVLLVRVLMAVFKVSPVVPGALKGAVKPEEYVNFIAGGVWLALCLAILIWRRWHNRPKHPQGEAAAGKVTIWVAELEGDNVSGESRRTGDHRENIVGTLRRKLGNCVLIRSAAIELHMERTGNAEQDTGKANRRAQEFLREQKGDLLIWGRVWGGERRIP